MRINFVILLFFITLFPLRCVNAEETIIKNESDHKGEQVIKVKNGVKWVNKDNSTQIFLEGTPPYHTETLTVISKDDLKILYHTQRFWHEKIEIKELVPVESSLDKHSRKYIVTHHFSRSSMWIAIEVQRNGKRVNELSRYFHGNIYQTRPNNEYWK